MVGGCVGGHDGAVVGALLLGSSPAVGQAFFVWLLARCTSTAVLSEQQVFFWQSIWALHRPPFDATSIDWKHYRLLRKDGVVRPHAIGLAQHGLLTAVLYADACKRVLLLGMVHIDQSVSVVVLGGRRRSARAVVRVPALHAADGVGVEVLGSIEQVAPLHVSHHGLALLLCAGAHMRACACGTPLLRRRSAGGCASSVRVAPASSRCACAVGRGLGTEDIRGQTLDS